MASFFIQCIMIGAVNGCIYLLAGLGWMIVHNVTRVLNFTQGEFVMMGGMLAVTGIQLGIPPFFACLLAVILTTLIGCLIERLIINPLRNAPDITIMIATIGASICISTGALLLWGWEPRSMEPFTEGTISLFGAVIVSQALWVFGATLVMVSGILLFFKHTFLGRALTATAIDQDAARLMGINPGKMSIIAFALASGLGAAGGIVATPIIMTSYSIGIMISVKGLVAAVVGRFDPRGILIVSISLGLMESLAAGFISSGFRDIISLTLVVLVLVALMPKFVSTQD